MRPSLRELLTITEAVHPVIADVDGVVERLLDAAGLDEADRDIGTSGLCATFALVLYRALLRFGINSTIVFLCGTRNGKAVYERGHQDDVRHLFWRHAAVRIGRVYFDIDGRVQLSHMIENYCWGLVGCDGVAPIDVSPSEAIAIIRAEKSAYDVRYRNIWVRKLGAAIKQIEAQIDEPNDAGHPPLS